MSSLAVGGALIGYVAVYLLLVGLIWRWRVNRRQERPPVEVKLLRGPAETLQKQLEKMDEKLIGELVLASLAPLLIFSTGTLLAAKLPAAQWPLLAVALAASLTAMTFSGRRLFQLLDRRRNSYLGYFGERVVAESLDALKARGVRVFHDVPCGDPKTPFNIDHVIVGPQGVFAVETKTRRKGRSREGFAAHEIIYDGQVLAYPWGEDRHGLEQAARQARWLEDWFAQLLGRRTAVQPILTFPGWMIIRRGEGIVRVLNPKEISGAVMAPSQSTLDAREFDLITRQLDARCRDVEF